MRSYLDTVDDRLAIRFAGRTNWQRVAEASGRLDLLRTNNPAQLCTIVQQAPPTHILVNGDGLSTIGEWLRQQGYCYRGWDGEDVQFSLPSVLMVAGEKWSTGSIVRDLRHISKWHVDLLDWSAPPTDLEQILREYDSVISFSLASASPWPALNRHGVVCCGAIDLELLRRRGWKPWGEHFGCVSRDTYAELTKLPLSQSVQYTPASARVSRFTRNLARPIKRLGWCGVPASAKYFGFVDAKHFSLFEEIAKAAGLEFLVSYQNYTYATMQSFYDAVDLLVCSSSTEGGPLPPFEAIACGVPVISTNVGLIKEMATIPTFETVQQAVEIIAGLQPQATADQQYQELTARMSTECFIQHWEEFFTACSRFNATFGGNHANV